VTKMATILLAALLLSGCSGGKDDVVVARKPAVYTVNYPLAYFAERIGGEAIEVVFPAIEGDPAFWRPSTEDVSAFQSADLVLLNGASYAKWIPSVTLVPSRMVNTAAAFTESFIPLKAAASHSHGDGPAHAHGDIAFTTWLDPTLAVQQASAIRDALTRLLPEMEAEFRQRCDTLSEELNSLDRQLSEITGRAPLPLVFSHPVYQYFVKRYALNGKSVHWEPDLEPTPKQWDALKEIQKGHPAQWMIWEGEPDPSAIAKLKQAGFDSLTFDPCGNVPASGDYMSVMAANVENLKRSFH
jgi:zinc transport system substrate-binding protein